MMAHATTPARVERFLPKLSDADRDKVAHALDVIHGTPTIRHIGPRPCGGPDYCEGLVYPDDTLDEHTHAGRQMYVETSLMTSGDPRFGNGEANRIETFATRDENDVENYISFGMEDQRQEIRLRPDEARELARVLVELADAVESSEARK